MQQHGGDIYSYKEKTGRNIEYDFSANINPFGISNTVKQAITESISDLIYYPDPENRKLINEISNFHGVEKECIVCGNGGADVIYRTVSAVSPSKSLIIEPTFTEYSDALDDECSEIKKYRLKYPFEIDDDFIKEIESNEYDLIVLCNPNNPTGTLTDKEILTKIIQTAKKKESMVLLDECFFDMTELKSEKNSFINRIDEFSNLIIIKSLTKMYALPGIRLGYALSSNKELIKKIRCKGQPWSVNTLASEAGIAALKDYEYRAEFIEYIEQERNFLYNELKKLGFEVWKPAANFIFFKASGMGDLDKELLKYNILIRHCDNYPGLNAEYYRICVKLRNDNLFLLDCLDKIRKEKDSCFKKEEDNNE